MLLDIDLSSPKFGPTNEGALVQEEVINNSCKTLPSKDEDLKNDVHLSPKMYLPHEDHLVQVDDIVTTFPSDTIPLFQFIEFPTIDEVLMSYVCPSPKACLTHIDALEQEDEIIRNFLDALPSKYVSLESKELNQVNTIHVSSYEKPKPKKPPNILKVAKYICKRGDMERQLEQKYGFEIHHSFNACVKKKDPNVLTSLPSHPRKHVDKEPNLVEKLYEILANLSLWDLIQTSPSYHKLIQEAIQRVVFGNVPLPMYDNIESVWV